MARSIILVDPEPLPPPDGPWGVVVRSVSGIPFYATKHFENIDHRTLNARWAGVGDDGRDPPLSFDRYEDALAVMRSIATRYNQLYPNDYPLDRFSVVRHPNAAPHHPR